MKLSTAAALGLFAFCALATAGPEPAGLPEPGTGAAESAHPAEARSTIPWAGTRGVTLPTVRKRFPVKYPPRASKAKVGAGLLIKVLVRRDGSSEPQGLLGCRIWKWGKKPDEKHSEHCEGIYEDVAWFLESWEYDPPLLDGRPIDAFVVEPFEFFKKAGKRPGHMWSEEEILALLPDSARVDESGEAASLEPLERPPADLPEERTWWEVRSRHFTIFSNAGDAAARRVATRLELLREVLRRLTGDESVRAPRPTWVYLFLDERSFAPYNVGSNVGGYFLTANEGNFVALQSSYGFSPTIYHEYLHYFLENNLPYIPLWLNEGIAELYSTFEVDGDVVLIGGIQRRHAELLRREALLPLDRLFAVTTEAEDYNEAERKGLFYAQSWGLAHTTCCSESPR